jgi:hypothetical protein
MIGYVAATTVTSNAARKAHIMSAGRIIRRLGESSGFPESGGDWLPLATTFAAPESSGCRSSDSVPLDDLPSRGIVLLSK